MKHLKLFFALFAMLALGVGNAWGAEKTYTFTSKSWGDSESAWTSNKDGGQLSSGRGVQVSTTYTGASATSKNEFNNVSRVVVVYSTNASKGAGIINMQIGSNAQKSFTVTSSGGTTDRNAEFSFSPAESGKVKLIINCTTNSIYVKSITIETSESGGETPGEGGGEDPVDPTPEPGSQQTITIKYNSTFTPSLPTASGSVNTTSTAHTVEGISVKEKGIYKGASNNYLMFVQDKGFLYNTQSLGTITSVSVTYTNGTSTSGKAGVYFGSTEQSTYTTTSNQTIKGQSQTDTWTNTTEGNGFFQLSTSNKNVQITQIEITYTSGSEGGGGEETVPSLTTDQFSWSATTATATLPNTFDNPPTLKNTKSLAVSYSSSKGEVATVDEDGNVTLVGKGETIISATAGDDETYKKTTVSYTLTVKPAPLAPIAGGVIDILNQDWTDVTGTNYTDVAAKTAENEGHSNAQYVAQCAGDKSSIQLRSNNNNSGVVSTISGGIVKRVEVEWQNETAAGRILQVYGSNTAYEAATDLYSDDKKGELLGEITMGGDETVVDYSQWTGDYKYIGLRSKSGAMYLTTITITWLPINSKVTIDGAIQNGSINVKDVADLNAVAAGTVLTLENTPEAGYKFVKYNVYKTDEPTTEIDVENSKFTMPEYDVTVSATFTSIKELDRIEVNTTNVKKTFWQGETFNSTGLVVTAYYTDETYTIVTPNSITGSTAEAGTKQVTVSYTEGDITKETQYDITVKAIANNEETPYTVIEAREIIDAVGNTTVEVYVQGIVSKIVNAFNPTYGNISYDISTDGLKTSDQLQAYRGFSYDGDWFTSADDIQVGDVVIVKGKLKIHNTTYELDEGNQLVKLERSDEPKPTAATLPFEFDGNKDDIADVVGMSQTGLGTYDSSPKLKFDTENDNVIIHFDSEPGEFSFLLKQNGSSVGTFTVYESANGEDYTSVWSGGDLGGNGKSTTIKPTLPATSRYVKFEYTTKPSGTNYGLGQISIKKIDKRQDAGIAWNPATISLTVGDAFTAPTFNNPNGLSGITFASSNEALATVNNAGVISLVSGKTGTATITATFADGHAEYKPAEATCVITVSPKSEKVVILAQYAGNWYALMAQGAVVDGVTKTDRLAALPVAYFNGTLYNVEDADKALITWERVVTGDKATFKNGENYISGTASSTDLKLSTTECAWTLDGSTYKIGNRTFIYRAQANGFKNYNTTTTPGTDDYSNLPVVTAPVYGTGTITPMENLTPQMYGTICLENNVVGYEGITFYEVAGKEGNKVIFDEVTEVVAGMPYIYIADSETATIVIGEEIALSASKHKSLQGTFTQIDPAESNILTGNYILYNNVIKMCGKNCGLKDHKAYFIADELGSLSAPQAQMPGRRRVSLNTTGENAATGIGDVVVPTEQATKVIINGQLIIIRDGEKFNVQGQRL